MPDLPRIWSLPPSLLDDMQQTCDVPWSGPETFVRVVELDREKLVPAIADALAGLGGDPDPDVYAMAAMAVFDALNGERG